MIEANAKSSGVAFLVSAGMVYEVIAGACSSPQTTEINASSRSDTLMKWVHLGIGQAALFVGIAAYIDKTRRAAILAGGGLACAIMYGMYVHAKAAGLASSEPGTEGQGQNGINVESAAVGGAVGATAGTGIDALIGGF